MLVVLPLLKLRLKVSQYDRGRKWFRIIHFRFSGCILRMLVRYIRMSCFLQHLEVWNFSVAAVMKPGTIEHKTLRRLETRGTGIKGAFTCKWTYEIYTILLCVFFTTDSYEPISKEFSLMTSHRNCNKPRK